MPWWNRPKSNQDKRPRSWSERKLTRVQGQSETNGNLAPLQLADQNRHTDHYHAPTATPEIDKKNSHMLVRDEYPEVVHAERSAESDERYQVPSIVPDVMVDWVTRLVNNESATFYQMDPLSSPHELSPIYSEKTPLKLWFTPADMKMFLRPSDENLEDAWRRAMSLLCFTIHILREACEFTDLRQTSFGSTYMALLGCAQVMKIATLWTEEAGRRGVILAKSQEGLYMNPQDSTFMAEQWETMGSGSEVKVGPESPAIVYANDELVGVSTDCRALTKETCGIAIVDDQQSLIADLILDLGLTKSRLVAGAIQRKEEYLRTWVDAYHLYKDKCKSPNNIKNMLKERLREGWDSWPNKVWKVTDEGVQLVRAQIAKPKPERSTGILQCFWNSLRKKPSATNVKQEEPEDMDMAISPDSWTGDMPLNALVTLDCYNRPDQLPFINATNQAKQSHDDDQIVMPCKCPAAFEWKSNQGWNAEERLQQRIHLEASKDPHLWDGPLGHKVQAYKDDLESTWGNKKKGKQAFWDCQQNSASSLSEEEKVLLRWMCIHATLGGTATSNPKPGNVFEYIYSGYANSTEFVFEGMDEVTGISGLYSASGYVTNDPTLDTWADMAMDYIYEQPPISKSVYKRSENDYQKFMKSVVHFVAMMMHDYQRYHVDLPTVFGLSQDNWRIWCMQWHMYKRDYEIARTHTLIPAAGIRYEVICLYLETLLRLEVTESETGDGDSRQRTGYIQPNPQNCPFCGFKYKYYATMANAAHAVWTHCESCAKDTLKVKDDGPNMPAFSMQLRETISVMEAKMTAVGGLDFEPNFEVIFGGLLQEVLAHRLQAFRDLVTYHKASQKAPKDGKTGKPFGINVNLWRLIANGQIFNQRYLHPWDNLDHFADESQQCSDLLEEWLRDAEKTSKWGTLVIRKTTEEFPSKMFSFSSSVRFGPARAKANPRLHPNGFQSHPKDVRICVPAKGPLPMGSFCGADGYGLIHPNMISASVLQCCIASSQEADESNMFKFDAMALAPNMDLLMTCKDAEKVAQTIAHWNCGKPRTPKLELIHPPGGTMPLKDVGSKDWNLNVQKEVDSVFKQKPFRHWTPTTEEYNQEQRRKDREGVAKMLKATENSLFTHMGVLNTQMGANLRAYHYLRNQELLGMKPVEKITLLQVKEVVDKVVESKWLNPPAATEYTEYLPSAGGNLDAITDKFKGRKRLRVLWDVTGYEVARGSWSKPKTKEEYLKTLAVFWSMDAPLTLPSLPGVGCDPVKIGSITVPDTMWEEDDRVGCNYVPMTSEELAEPATPRRPSRVRNTPDVGQESWHPILSQSEHAYGWWMLSPDEQSVVIDNVKARSERAATSRLAPPKAKSLVTVKKEKPPVKPKGTTSKSGSSSAVPPAKATTTTIVSTSGQPAIVPMQGLISKELKNPPPQSVQSSSASMREQSNPRGKSEGGGIFSLINRGRPSSMGQGTPSVAPDQAKGAVPRPPSLSTPPRSRSAERHGSTSTPRTETPPRSRSEERSDGKGDDRTPTRQTAQTAMSWLDSSRRQSSAEPPREAPATSEGLGPIVIGGHDQRPSDPPQEEENRSSSSPGMISRAISAISNMGRGPRPTRGRSEERTVAGAPQPPSGDSDGDSSSYGSDVRVHQNPVAQEPRIPASQRPEVPIPPMFREDEVLLAGIQIGVALQAQQEENHMLREHLGGMVGLPPPRRDQPPDEPDPELPGASEPPSEQPTDATSTELVDDDSEETLDFNEAEERSDNPEITDNDPYEQQEDEESETEEPADSQADVRADPDVTQIDIDDSSEEVKESETPEQPSQGEETPKLAAEATESPPESVEAKEKAPVPSKPYEFTGSIADWEKLKSLTAEHKHGKSPLKESAAKSSEHAAPQASPSETTSTKEDKEQSSKSTQGEGESSSASQAPPAETSAAAASEDPKPVSSEQTSSEANPKPSGKFGLGKLNRRRKPIQKPRQETDEEKAERERLEKIADEAAKQNAAELIAQEQKEKQALTDKEARSKQAAAANTEKAREAADKAKKQKEAEKAEVPRSVTRRMKKAPEKEDGDLPDDDPTPWTVFTYRQPQQVRAGYTYEGVSINNKMNVIDPQYTVNTKATHLGNGRIVTPIREVLLLQGGKQAFAGAKHRIRDIRSVQIERTFTTPMTLFPAGHMCNTKDGKSVVMRVTTPYSTTGELLLRTLPGESPTRYTLKNPLQIHHLKLEADFKDNKLISPLAHCVLHFATRAVGYKLKEGKVAERPAWFTPEVLRAARVFIKEVSSGQYTNEDHTKTTKPAFVYHPSVLTNYPEEAGKGRFRPPDLGWITIGTSNLDID